MLILFLLLFFLVLGQNYHDLLPLPPGVVDHLQIAWNIELIFENHCRTSFKILLWPDSVLLCNPGKVI